MSPGSVPSQLRDSERVTCLLSLSFPHLQMGLVCSEPHTTAHCSPHPSHALLFPGVICLSEGRASQATNSQICCPETSLLCPVRLHHTSWDTTSSGVPQVGLSTNHSCEPPWAPVCLAPAAPGMALSHPDRTRGTGAESPSWPHLGGSIQARTRR